MNPSSNREQQLGRRTFDSGVLEGLFEQCFLHDHRSQLVGGESEPLYLPAATGTGLHTLYYREDFFASALHEVSHWCLAGTERRLKKDYGYWYSPDGRDSATQRKFEQVEAKPQALEWVFAKACGYSFRISVDNLSGAGDVSDGAIDFKERILMWVQHWCETGMPIRGLRYYRALCEYYDRPASLREMQFSLAQLDAGL